MKNYIKHTGKIMFDPIDKTNKHSSQSSWKKTAMIMFDSDISEYYAWFIKKRYNIVLNKPLRGSHISFINDSKRDIKTGSGLVNETDVDLLWNIVKNKWNNKSIDVTLNVDTRSDGKHWWLNIPEENRTLIHDIRKEIGLDRPYFGLHLSIGYTNDKNIEHSKYIIGLINKFGLNYY